MPPTGYDIEKVLAGLEPQHRRALQWFMRHADEVRPWPRPTEPGVHLATVRKGIYKPQWSKYALSIRQNLSQTYPDLDPIWRDDGTWSYMYFQEGHDLDNPEGLFTNKALFNNWRDQIPVGVFRQATAAPKRTYHILGLALVVGWDGGFFFLEGIAPAGLVEETTLAASEIDRFRRSSEALYAREDAFSAADLVDARKRVVASIVKRQGQPEFRRTLLDAYEGRCAVTDYDALEALEAAHIVPYRGPETNDPSNGLLLRADLHTLFDVGLVAVDTSAMTLVVGSELDVTRYREYAGRGVRIPKRKVLAPSAKALDIHRRWAGL